MPPHVLGDPIQVLEELPRQPGLADPGDARDLHQLRLALLRGSMKDSLNNRSSRSRPTNGASNPSDSQRAPARRRHPNARHTAPAPLFPFNSCSPASSKATACSLALRVDSPTSTSPARPGLDPGGRIHQISGDHSLAGRRNVHRRLTREHPGARTQVSRPHLISERRHRRDQVERRPHRALRVVLLRHRRAPHRHHRIADELLDRPPVQLHQPRGSLEIAGQQLPHVLRVATPTTA